MVLAFLNDFAKRTTDLFKPKKFVFDRTVEVNVDKSNNISWNAKHVLKGDNTPDTKLTVKQHEKDFGDLELELGNDEKVKFTLQSRELVDNLDVKLELCGQDNGKLETSYQAQKWAGKVDAKYCKSPTVETQVSCAYDNCTVGLGATLNSDGGLVDYNVGVRLDQDADRSYVLTSQNQLNDINVAFYYNVSKDAELAASVDIDMSKGKIGIVAGGSYNVDECGLLRYFVDSSADLSLAYEYKFSDRVQGFVGTKYNLADNKQTEGFGYKLVFDC